MFEGIIIIVLSILTVIIVLHQLITSRSKEKELQRYNAIYVQQLEQCKQYMKEKESVRMEFRNIRHDMKYQFIALEGLLKAGKNEEAISFLQEIMQKRLIDLIYICRTDNIFVDSLINTKYAYMKQNNILFQYDIHIPINLPFDSADICILLGNILDNAMEASIKLPEEQRKIEFYLRYEKNYLILNAMNSFTGDIKRGKKGILLTKKSDVQNHGFGLKSIHKIADKYFGSVVIDTENRVFCIKVVLLNGKNDI